MEHMNLVLIHGAWSTSNTFNCLINAIESTENLTIIKINYDCQKHSLSEIISRIKKELTSFKQPTIVVGHSLGGIIALSLEQEPSIKRIITLASPISGLQYPKIAEAFLSFRAPIIKDITYDSKFMMNLRKKKFKKPIDILVSTSGYNPMILEKNDGVVTVSSQTYWIPSTGKIKYVSANHHEILQTKEFIETVKKHLG